MYKLAVFDFDSTLMDGETLEFIAKEVNLEKEIKEITSLAMQGKLDFFESLIKRVAMLKGIEKKKVDAICAGLPLMNGAKTTIKELKKQGITVVCFSGGFQNALEPASEVLDLDGYFCNVFHVKNNLLTGLVGGDMMFSDSKGTTLKNLQNILKISPAETIVVGDGANDISMFGQADCRIAFCAKDVLKQEASIIIDDKDLTVILDEIYEKK